MPFEINANRHVEAVDSRTQKTTEIISEARKMTATLGYLTIDR